MSILVLAEHDGQKLKQATRQAVGAARAWHLPIHVLLVGHNLANIAQEAAAIEGIAQVIRIDAPHLAHPLAEDVAEIVARQGGKEYRVILAPHTSFGKNVLPRASALLDVAMLSDVIAILGPSSYLRPIYAGNIYATVESTDPIQVLTVRASSFTAAANGGAADIVARDAPAGTTLARWLGETHNRSDRPELATSRVVVSGGRSLGSAEQFEAVLAPLAKELSAALGATRAAVDAGYAPNNIQVGQTGIVVAPELYIAVGISGAVQHTAGMKDSKIIVAINQDADAPIFQVADYGLVANLFEAVPALVAALNSSEQR
jgi:electron transfer flavoprotein alpha subunit